MFDVQTASSLGNSQDNTNNPNPTFTVTVPAGRVPISAGFKMSHPDRARLQGMWKSASDTYSFKFGDNMSGSAVTIDLYVYHVPESEVVEVLRVKP